jgi:hypothetical protein
MKTLLAKKASLIMMEEACIHKSKNRKGNKSLAKN